jgi:hypothetical protein
MGLFGKFFKTTKSNELMTKKYLNEDEIEQLNKDFARKFDQLKELFTLSLNIYNSESCQCAFPRFQQIIGIDCSRTGNSFKCYETDLLINLSKPYFNIEKSELSDECTNEKWICKKCGSIYEYGWSDFSLYIERQKLKLQNLTVSYKGMQTRKPIPLFLGLIGHSYPPRTEITSVDFAVYENYMTEK